MSDKIVSAYSVAGLGDVVIFSRTEGDNITYQAQISGSDDDRVYGASGSEEETLSLTKGEVASKAYNEMKAVQGALENAIENLQLITGLEWKKINADKVKAGEAVTNSE